MLELHRYTREARCPCHRLSVSGGPARVWCRVSGRSFHADDPQLDPAPSVARGA